MLPFKLYSRLHAETEPWNKSIFIPQQRLHSTRPLCEGCVSGWLGALNGDEVRGGVSVWLVSSQRCRTFKRWRDTVKTPGQYLAARRHFQQGGARQTIAERETFSHPTQENELCWCNINHFVETKVLLLIWEGVLVKRPNTRSRAEGARLPSLTASACWYLSGLRRSHHSQSESAHQAFVSEKVPRSRHHKLILGGKKETTLISSWVPRTTLQLCGWLDSKADGQMGRPVSRWHTDPFSEAGRVIYRPHRKAGHKSQVSDWLAKLEDFFQNPLAENQMRAYNKDLKCSFGLKTPQLGWKIARSRTRAQIQNVFFLSVCFVPNLQADVWVLR